MQLAAVLIDILKHLKLVTPALAVRRTHLLQVLERVQGVAPLSSEQGAELRDLGVEGTRVVDCAQDPRGQLADMSTRHQPKGRGGKAGRTCHCFERREHLL